MAIGIENQMSKAHNNPKEMPQGLPQGQSNGHPSGIRHISVYGSHEKKGKRWEVAGTEKELLQVLPQIVEHPPKNRFPCFNPYPNVVLGDWDNDIVKVDWDERLLTEVKRFSRLMNERYSLDGFIILQSSTKKREIRDQTLDHICYSYKSKSYHTVFNRVVSEKELNGILAWLCLFTKDNGLITWFLLQNIKGTYTLRHGFKRKKGSPKIVYKFGNQDKQIAKFLANRKFILDFLASRAIKRCFGHMDNFVTGNCGACSKETREECYEKSFGDYLPNVKERFVR